MLRLHSYFLVFRSTIKLQEGDRFLPSSDVCTATLHHCPSTRILHKEKSAATYYVCTATRVMLKNFCAITCKNHAIPSLHRDRFLAKVPGPCPAASSGNP